MATGTVKWSNATKGYGFIRPEGGGDDMFVHIRQVLASGLTDLRVGRSWAFFDRLSILPRPNFHTFG